MISFRDLSIRRKLTVIIMATCAVVVLLASAGFLASDFITYRDQVVSRASGLARRPRHACSMAQPRSFSKRARARRS